MTPEEPAVAAETVSRVITLMLTREQREQLDKAAQEAGKTPEEFARHAVVRQARLVARNVR